MVPGLAVANEHIDLVVLVAGTRLDAIRQEGDVMSVGTERWQPTRVVTLRAAGGDAHARDERLCPGKCRRTDSDEHEYREAAYVKHV